MTDVKDVQLPAVHTEGLVTGLTEDWVFFDSVVSWLGHNNLLGAEVY